MPGWGKGKRVRTQGLKGASQRVTCVSVTTEIAAASPPRWLGRGVFSPPLLYTRGAGHALSRLLPMYNLYQAYMNLYQAYMTRCVASRGW